MQYIFENMKQTIFLTCAFAVLILCLTSATFVRADQTLTNIATGTNSVAVAVNPVTNRIYIANRTGNTVTVINGADNSTTTVNVGTAPQAIAVNTETNRIYVVNQNSNNVTVINGADNSTQTVAVGSSPFAAAVNPVTNRIYVTNFGDSTVTVINGADNSTNTVTLSGTPNPRVVAVNPVTNRIYVGVSDVGASPRNLYIINGADNSAQSINLQNPAVAIAVNPATNKIYTVDVNGFIKVVDAGNNNQVTTLFTAGPGNGNPSIAVNPATNRIYLPNGAGGTTPSVTVINGATNTTQSIAFTSGNQVSQFDGVAVNTLTDKIYVIETGSNTVRVIKGLIPGDTFPTGAQPLAIAVNPATNRIYTANSGGNSATLIDGGTLTFGSNDGRQTIAAGTRPVAVGVNPVTNRAYVANSGSNNVTVIDSANNFVSTIPVGAKPVAVAVNPILNQIYVVNQDGNSLAKIFGSNGVTDTFAVGTNPVAVAVNPVMSRVYVVNQNSGSVTVIDVANSNAVSTVAVGTMPVSVAVNPATNRIYVVNQNSNNVTVINGADNSTQTVAVGNSPSAIAVNPATNRIYVGISGGIAVINGANNSIVTTIPATSGIFNSIAVNPVTNRIYAVSNNLSRLFVINGADNTAQVFGNFDNTFLSVAVNPATNKFYVGGQNLTQFDGATNIPQVFSAGGGADDIAVNVRTDQVFVANQFSNAVNIFSPTPSVAVPLTTSVAGSNFTNNTTASSVPTFNLTATTTTATAPRNIYYQLDGKQGEWRRAVPTGNTATTLTATATAPFLYNGIHTIYFFATDGTDSSSINPSRFENDAPNLSKTAFDFGGLAPEASSITGQIGSYQFLVAAPAAPTAATVSVGGRVTTSDGRGIRNARVTLTKSNGESQTVLTGTFGYYRFADVPTGETYIFSVFAKRYTFAQNTQVRSVMEDTDDINFVADALWKRDEK